MHFVKAAIEEVRAVWADAKRYDDWQTVIALLNIFVIGPLVLVWVVNGTTATDIAEVLLLSGAVALFLFFGTVLERVARRRDRD
jgi:hypothetical protein